MKTQVTEIVTAPAVDELQNYLNKIVIGDAGEITLDTITKNVKNLGKYEIVEQLRKNKSGELIVGRRGHATRFAWGVPKPQPVIKSRKHNSRKPAVEIVSATQHGLALKINLGGVEQRIPLTMELVPS